MSKPQAPGYIPAKAGYTKADADLSETLFHILISRSGKAFSNFSFHIHLTSSFVFPISGTLWMLWQAEILFISFLCPEFPHNYNHSPFFFADKAPTDAGT